MNALKKRLPDQKAILGVFSFLVFAVFSWSVRGFLFEVPSFLLYYDLGEIAAIFFFQMMFALLESALAMGGLLVLAVLLPQKWVQSGFSYKGFLAVLVAAAGMIFLQDQLTFRAPREWDLLIGFVVGLAIVIALTFLVARVSRLQAWIDSLLDRFVVFVYLYVPLGVIGMLVVVIRNIF